MRKAMWSLHTVDHDKIIDFFLLITVILVRDRFYQVMDSILE